MYIFKAIATFFMTIFALGSFQTGALASTIITYRGNISQGFDGTGVFGNPSRDLSGSPFSITFTIMNSYNPFSYLILSNGSNVNPMYQPIRYPRVGSGWSGRGYGEFSPMSAVIEINNRSVKMLSQRSGEVDHSGPGGTQSLVHHRVQDLLVLDNSVDVNISISSQINKFTNSWDYRSPMTYIVQPADTSFGYFSYLGLSCSTTCSLIGAGASFAPSSFSIQRGVPEPTIWLLMVAGVGGVGTVLRRRAKMASNR